MAQFPNAVVSFATKNPGDVIPSADWNSQNAEIIAIEDGYLNGTARLNSSASTLATLSVVGNSTINGVQNVIGGRCLLLHSAKSDIANNSLTGLNWDTETADPSGMHSTSVNSSRITFAASTGLYHVGCALEWSAST